VIGIVRAEPMPLKALMKIARVSVPDLAATVGCRTDYLRKVLNGKERGSTELMRQLEEIEQQLNGK